MQNSSKATSGRVSKVKTSQSKTKGHHKGSHSSGNKSIKVPPPTINPYNTMSNLKTHSSQHRHESQIIHSLPQSKLSMTSTSKLIKGSTSGHMIMIERPSTSGANFNDRSSTSNSNYYN